MVNIFGYGTSTASSSRIESNFNHVKNRVFKNENLPLRVDKFVEMLINYYRGDHLLLEGQNKDNDNLEFNDENQCEGGDITNQFFVDKSSIRQDNIRNITDNEESDGGEFSYQIKNSNNHQNGDYDHANVNYEINRHADNRETKYSQYKSIHNDDNDYNGLLNNEAESISDNENEYKHEEENGLDDLKINENDYLVVGSIKKKKKKKSIILKCMQKYKKLQQMML